MVTFLEQVTTVLQGTSPVQRKLMESTRAEISRVARRATRMSSGGGSSGNVVGGGGSSGSSTRANRLSLDSQSIISRTESMPGL